MWWVQLIVLVVSYIVSVALAPKAPTPKPAALADFNIPVSEQGRPVPVIFGTMLITDPNLLWYGDLRTTPIKTSGGKK